MLTSCSPKLAKKIRLKTIVFLLISLTLFCSISYLEKPELIKINFYSLSRIFNRKYLAFAFKDWNELKGRYCTVKYKNGDQSSALIVLSQAEEVYEQLTDRYQLFKLPLPLTVIIYPSSEELNSSLGWSAEESALGAYQAGLIRLLSPSAYLPGVSSEQLEEVYRNNGPLIHEFTHLLVDYKAGGNYPRWFTEGLAQYEEKQMLGLVWSKAGANWFSFEQLSGKGFDLIEDQAGAYWQSLVLVDNLVAAYGWDRMENFLTGLASGVKFETAFANRFGIELSLWEAKMKDIFG